MPKIINRPNELTVNNRRVTARSTTIPNKFTGTVERVETGYKVYPYKTLPDIFVYFDESGEYVYQSRKKEESDQSVEWSLQF